MNVINNMKTFHTILEGVISPNVSSIRKRLAQVYKIIVSLKDDVNDDETIKILDDAFSGNKPPVSFEISKESGDISYMEEVHVLEARIRIYSHERGNEYIKILVTPGISEVFNDLTLWDKFVSVVIENIEHELTHHKQYERIPVGKTRAQVLASYVRKTDKGDITRNYLQNPHECMALARQQYIHMRELDMSNKEIRKEIRKAKIHEFQGQTEPWVILNAYRVYFKNHRKELNQFLKYLWSYTQ